MELISTLYWRQMEGYFQNVYIGFPVPAHEVPLIADDGARSQPWKPQVYVAL